MSQSNKLAKKMIILECLKLEYLISFNILQILKSYAWD